MTTLAPEQSLALRQTNVSNPSVIHSKASQQSFAASEDYYSFSGTSSDKSSDTIPAEERDRTTHAINRYITPPSRYRTPLQSRDQLPSQSRDNLGTNNATEVDEKLTKTPLRGPGSRRYSAGPSIEAADTTAGPSAPAAAVLKEGGIRRKPVPSLTMDSSTWPGEHQHIEPSQARSSIAKDIGRDTSPPTPGEDDTPYIRFALDQLTRDEEVRGSRQYRQYGDYEPLPTAPVNVSDNHNELMTKDMPHYDPPNRELEQPATVQWPTPQRNFDEPSPRSLKQTVTQQPAVRTRDPSPDLFVPVSDAGKYYTPLRFLPGILRPFGLGMFVLLLLAYIGLLLVCAIFSLTRQGLFDYGSFGDGYYYVCQYLPTLLGIVLFLWLVQIEVAVYRVAPFIALASNSARSRQAGVNLPLYPKSFLSCYLGHFRAGQPIIAIFLIVSWLQIFTIPLLASAFNVYYYGSPHSGQWRWIATQATTWTIIGLYLLLLISVVSLMLWLRRQNTGLQWDPKTLADMIVLLERSNALPVHDDEKSRNEPAQLGYWRTTGSHEIFHTYGLAEKPARQYEVKEGRIREKVPTFSSDYHRPTSERSNEPRSSRERMLPQWSYSDLEAHGTTRSHALPWFLRPAMALLWPIIAIVLVAAFLVVSYLPVTQVFKGFNPDLAVPVDALGFSASNFLYSFIPSVLATICLLGWLDIDFAYRRLQPYSSLLHENGELAERSLLLSYTSRPPFLVTAAALVNGHLRIALFTLTTLVAAALPILAGGLFWSQFYVSTQMTRITANQTAYYALSALLSWYALSYLFTFPSRRLRRDLDYFLPADNHASRFIDIVALVRGSRLLDDIAFHHPKSKTDLVTRLLSAVPAHPIPVPSEKSPLAQQQSPAAAASKVSLAADSVRGFGNARKNVRAGGTGLTGFAEQRFGLGRFEGRDGREFVGLDRIGR